MTTKVIKVLKVAASLLLVIFLTLLVARAYQSQRGLPLEVWHTHVPHELTYDEMEKASWADYMKHEEAVFQDVRTHVTQTLDPKDRVAINRYFEGSPIYPGHFKQDWNRSFVLMPDGPITGVAVFLHGLTDSPYSQRHIAARYRERGFVAITIRLPGHGTVPAGLTDVEWEDWMAATRLAVREGRRLAGDKVPLHLIGFSNGGALALMYALDALDDFSLAKPERIVLISPMVGITRFARFAGLAGLPAFFPAFAKAAWLGVMPEFNPFKYNSFPINAARQSYLLTDALQRKIVRLSREARLSELAPILTFQSVIDFTVSTRAIISSLFVHLPRNGSELVLFDINRNTTLEPLLRAASDTMLTRLLPAPPRNFRTTIIANASPSDSQVAETVTEAGEVSEKTRALGLTYPLEVFSLSHVALPFPMDDALYGMTPGTNKEFGISLGAMAARGERGTLIVALDALMRMSSNPFYPYMLERIDEGIPGVREAPQAVMPPSP